MTSRSDRPILDVPNPRRAFVDLQSEYAKLHDLLVGLSIQHTNMVTGFGKSPQSDQFFLLRDCILYRRSVLFSHLDILLAVRENHLDRLARTRFDSAEHTDLLYNGGEQLFGLFDSLTFHSISLFDYLGNLIDFVCVGKQQTNLKWPGVVSACRDKKNALSSSPVAPAILECAKEFVDKLYDHRSQLIHYSKDLGAAVLRFDPMSGKSDFTVFAPHQFVHSQHELREQARTQDLTVIYVAFWIVRQTLEAACKIVQQMFKHIEQNRKMPPGQEFFILKPRLKDDPPETS